MSVGSSKRKRDAEPDTEERQPRKARVIEGASDSQKSTGQSRQEKSERRSKKTKKAGKRGDAKAVPASETHPNSTTRNTDIQEDDLANGQDFISLSNAPAAALESQRKDEGEKSSAAKKKTKSKKKQESQRSTAAKVPDSKLENTEAEESSKQDQQAKFIVFVGNLPYSTTTEQIQVHFAKLAPFKVRHGTDKHTGKPKGFAFLEFEHYDRMKTCLKLYHHSMFDPDNPEQDGQQVHEERRQMTRRGRRINVELTAGGGGKSKQRSEKIKTKNQRLGEQRERRLLKEKAEKTKTAHERRDNPATGVNADAGDGDIHPSRAKLMKR